MAEGPPERPGRLPLPHIVVPWAASDQSYRGRSGGAPKPVRAIGDRQGHAARLSGELESARDAARAKLTEVSPEVVADGFALSVESWSDEPGYKLAVQSLDGAGAPRYPGLRTGIITLQDRNEDFTGRAAALTNLRKRLTEHDGGIAVTRHCQAVV